jgi:general secretion pathway protein D
VQFRDWVRAAGVCLALGVQVFAQQPQPPQNGPGAVFPGFRPLPTPQAPLAPNPAPPPTPATPQQTQPTGARPAPPPPGPPTVYGGLALNNASLTEVIDLLAQKLKINYILDPRVKGGVILNTYGETKDIDTRSLLETILRINGFGMVKQGELYRIVPLTDISHLPLQPEMKTDPNSIPEDDRTMLNLVFLKYVTADELVKVLEPFQGENARIYVYAPANLLLMLDSQRSMRRMMELVSLFDSDQLANQRVRVFTVKNGRPADVAKELENISKAISLSDKNAPIKFLPIDRINTIIAVAPNPGAFAEVEQWLAKLDVPNKVAAGGIKDYVYRVRFGDANSLACSIQALYGQLAGYGSYGGGQNAIMACMGASGNGVGGGAGGLGNGSFGAGALGNGFGNGGGGGLGNQYGAGAYGAGAYGAGAYGAGAYGAGPYGAGAYGAGAYGAGGGAPLFASPNGAAVPNAAGAAPGTPGATDLTGSYLGNAPPGFVRGPRVIANPMNNTLLIQATAQDYEGILQLVKELDVPPRQVLIEAKIYSVDLTRAFSSDVSAALQALSGSGTSTAVTSTAASLMAGLAASGGVTLSGAMLVGKTRALLGAVSLMETESTAKILSSPSIIATDSIAASINVGTTVPTLQGSISSAIGGAVTNAIGSASTGIGLSITARVTPSGIVTMIINQQVSAPQQTTNASSGSTIASPSFATKSISTQVTVQDGDTIAIGGMIEESTTSSLGGIPLLDRIPVVGALFGARSYSKERTELIIFLTPHVILDSNQLLDATDELKDQIKVLRKDVRE